MENKDEIKIGEWLDGGRAGLSSENLYYSDGDLGMSFISANCEDFESDGDNEDILDNRYSMPFPAELQSMDGSRESFYSNLARVAPWVGAEDAWLTGADDAKPALGDSTKPIAEKNRGENRDIALTELEVRMAARSVPPPPPNDAEEPPRPSRLPVKLAVTGALALVAAVLALGAREWTGKKVEATSIAQGLDGAYESRIASLEKHIRQLSDSNAQEETKLGQVERPPHEVLASIQGAGRVSNNAQLPSLSAEPSRPSAFRDPATTSSDRAYEPENRRPVFAGQAPLAEATAGVELSPAAVPSDEATGFNTDINPYDSQPEEPASSLESALDTAALERPKPEPAADESVSPTPVSSLSRAQVKSVMDGLNEEIGGCKPGSNERVIVEFTVSGRTGRVADARLASESPLNGTKEGQCVLRLVKLAKFPAFSADELSIKYPIYFQPIN